MSCLGCLFQFDHWANYQQTPLLLRQLSTLLLAQDTLLHFSVECENDEFGHWGSSECKWSRRTAVSTNRACRTTAVDRTDKMDSNFSFEAQSKAQAHFYLFDCLLIFLTSSFTWCREHTLTHIFVAHFLPTVGCWACEAHFLFKIGRVPEFLWLGSSYGLLPPHHLLSLGNLRAWSESMQIAIKLMRSLSC